jgi:serine/threonine protein phosphatase PrpC
VAGRASIVGAAETDVGKVRDHNEDCHFIDPEQGIFLVCDGMGGHAAGEVASALAVQTIRDLWSNATTQDLAEQWLAKGTPESHRQMMTSIHDGVLAAHDAILAEAQRDRTKGGMGTTLVGAIVVGNEIVFAHCGDSRAYLVRDGIAMQLTEDHTLLARLLAAGIDVDVNGDGARFKSMLTNALGIGQDCKVSTFVVPLADGDRFLLCSDGITEYLQEPEIGEVLCKQPSPARAAQRLVELALDRGGGDNATALVVRVLEAGETARPAETLRKDQAVIDTCPLWGAKLTPQQRLRALRIALPRDFVAGERVPAIALGDRVAWIIVAGELDHDGKLRGPGALLYPEALLADRPLPDKDGLAVTRGEVRALALRSDDFRELCDDDAELGEALLEALGAEIAGTAPVRHTGKIAIEPEAAIEDAAELGRASTLPPETKPTATRISLDDIATAPTAPRPPVPEHDEPDDDEPEIEISAAPEPEDAAPREMMPRRPSTERLFLAKEERAVAAADLEDALTKLTVDSQWGDLDDAPAPAPVVAKPIAKSDQSEPEISILPESEPEPEPVPPGEPPSPDSVGIGDSGEPAEIVMTVDDPEEGRIVEVVTETSSQTITMTADEPPEVEIVVIQHEDTPRTKRRQTTEIPE